MYALFDICIPTLTKEVVKQRQKITVKSFVQTVASMIDGAAAKVANALRSFDVAPAYFG